MKDGGIAGFRRTGDAPSCIKPQKYKAIPAFAQPTPFHQAIGALEAVILAEFLLLQVRVDIYTNNIRGHSMKRTLLICSALFLFGSAGGAHAAGNTWSGLCNWIPFLCSPTPKPPKPPVASVPEIDASSGTKALALVAGALLLVWEIRRRKS